MRKKNKWTTGVRDTYGHEVHTALEFNTDRGGLVEFSIGALDGQIIFNMDPELLKQWLKLQIRMVDTIMEKQNEQDNSDNNASTTGGAGTCSTD